MKTILVSGANGNLGVAVVRKFLDEGYQVIGIDHAKDHLSFAAEHPAFDFKTVDLTDEAAAGAFAKTMTDQYGQVDGALMLVGGFAMGTVSETTGEDLKKMVALNFETAYFLARPLLAYMKKNNAGRLVFIGTRPALQADAGKDMIGYALSKSLLFQLAALINEDCKGTNVTASVVVPSTIDTEANRKAMPGAIFEHWVRPEEIAEVLAFICSGKSSAIREGIYKVYNNA